MLAQDESVSARIYVALLVHADACMHLVVHALMNVHCDPCRGPTLQYLQSRGAAHLPIVQDNAPCKFFAGRSGQNTLGGVPQSRDVLLGTVGLGMCEHGLKPPICPYEEQSGGIPMWALEGGDGNDQA